MDSISRTGKDQNFDKTESPWNELKDKIHGCALKNTKFYDVADNYEVMKGLKEEVSPTLKELDFYGGYRCLEHDYVPASTHSNLDQIQDVTLLDLFKKFEKGHLTFVGPAGIGKTTILKAIARNVVNIKESCNNEYRCLEDIKLVHYIEGKYIDFTATSTTGQMLFNNTGLDENEIKQTIEFVKLHPERVLFVIDSLDTLRRSLDGVYTVISAEEEAHPEVILWHLLTGQLFPGCRVITSSREHAIRNYKGELRPNRVILMTGLSRESMGEMIFRYLGEIEGKEELEFLETKCPVVFELCRTPVFLVFTLMGRESDSEFMSTTLSGIMILLVQNLIRSEHAHKENLNRVIDQLKLLSFRGTEERRVLFTTTELKDFKLEPDQVTDLAVIAPSGKSTKLLENEHDYVFFSHQSIQELFTALAIAEMDTEAFKSFSLKSLHLPHYSMVRRLLCGLLLDKEVRKASKKVMKDNSENKKDYLKQSLKTQLSVFKQGTRDLLELFIAFSEAKEGVTDVISSTVHDISFIDTPLSKSDVYAIGSVAKQCEHLNKLKLKRCGIESAPLEILDSCLEGSNVKIKFIDLTANRSFGVKGMRTIARLIRQSHIEELKLADCAIDQEKLEGFEEWVGDVQVEECLSKNKKTWSGILVYLSFVLFIGLLAFWGQNLPYHEKSLKVQSEGIAEGSITKLNEENANVRSQWKCAFSQDS